MPVCVELAQLYVQVSLLLHGKVRDGPGLLSDSGQNGSIAVGASHVTELCVDVAVSVHSCCCQARQPVSKKKKK